MEKKDFQKTFVDDLVDIVTNNLKVEINLSDIHLDIPTNPEFGDWTSNISMILASQLKSSPREIATKIVEMLKSHEDLNEYIDSIDIAGAGFINIKLKNEYFLNNLLNINNDYGQFKQSKPLRIIVEMGDPNSHKLPHIGHLFSYIVGNSIANIYENEGHNIHRVTYQSDIGLPVAKCLYGWYKKGKPIPKTLKEKVDILQECYQEGSSLYKNEEDAKNIQEINKAIYTGEDKQIIKDWEETRQWSLDYYIQFEKLLGINIDHHYWESSIWKLGYETVMQNIGDDKAFQKSDGAIVFKGEKYGLHTRVFVTKNNTPTYEAKEIGLELQKMIDWPYDLTIIPTAHEQSPYFKVVIEAIKEIDPSIHITHIGHGMISTASGKKISSREGITLSGDNIVNMVLDRVSKIISERKDLTKEEQEDITNKVAIGAIKYSFLKSNILNNSTFNIEESISFDGNSGPYIQYTYARISTLIKKKEESKEYSLDEIKNINLEKEESDVIKMLNQFPSIVEDSAKAFAPHKITTYIFDLAQAFNQLYNTHPINSADTEEQIYLRRLIAQKTSIVLKNGLGLLGIETLEKM